MSDPSERSRNKKERERAAGGCISIILQIEPSGRRTTPTTALRLMVRVRNGGGIECTQKVASTCRGGNEEEKEEEEEEEDREI